MVALACIGFGAGTGVRVAAGEPAFGEPGSDGAEDSVAEGSEPSGTEALGAGAEGGAARTFDWSAPIDSGPVE